MKKQLIQARTLSGFRDILPIDSIAKEDMISKLKSAFRSFGFVPIETPHLEYSEILVGKGSDEIQKEMYRFFDHGNRDIALRFDHTIPLARFVVEHKDKLAFPFKRYVVGNVFRGERAQAGRFREFTQCDFDFIGTKSILADTEIIQLVSSSLNSLGITDFTIFINHRKILNGLAEHLGVSEKLEDILRIVDKIGKIGAEQVRNLLGNELGLSEKICEEILDFINLKQDKGEPDFFEKIDKYKGYNPRMKEGIEELKEIYSLLSEISDESHYIIDFSIARGLAYYTGVVFETILNEIPQIGSVSSGGRYDNLTKSFSEEQYPGVGGSIGLDRLIVALEQLGKVHSKGTTANVLLTNMGDSLIKPALILAKGLREAGISIEIYPEAGKLGKQFKYADKKGHKFVVVLGEDEVKNENFTLKNMQTGEQITIKNLENLLFELKKI
ncbi:MAG: histidine--tRNA ligase [Leptospiraceae bacterium]|nr:histidine--tRNA ligase [Leptospiraceae bacterium]MCP5497527.1 histidine--tRNA ligase [Leptospiraceae bacterium]